jgi:CubicO group peptidase (beta-lactamase class C family)
MNTALQQRLDELVEQHRKEHNITGAALAVVRGEEIVYARGYGRESIVPDSPDVTPDTLFRIASVTKPLTATMIMRLVEQGVLDLDTPIRTYIPWLQLSVPGAAEKLTLRLLLTHRGGFPTGGEAMGSRDPEGLERYVREYVPTVPLMASPGVGYRYSNHGLNLAGYVAEAASGKRYAQLMQELLFDPLGLERTTFDPLVALSYPLARPHFRHPDGTLTVWHNFFEAVSSYPGSYCISSVNDLAKMAMLHLHAGRFGGEQLLQPESIAEMQAVQTLGYRLNDFSCGLTWFRESKRGKTRFYHFGQSSYQYTSLLVFSPEDDLALVVLGNGEGMYSVGQKLFDILQFGEAVEEPELQANPEAAVVEEWPLYTGTYYCDFHGFLEVLTEEGELLLSLHGEKMTLSPLRERVYFARHPEGRVYSVGFPVQEDERVEAILLNGHVRGRREVPVYEANPADWSEWIGVYDDTVEQFRVDVREGKLVVWYSETEQEHEFEALDRDLFLSKTQGVIRFAYFNADFPTLVFHEAWRYPKVR